jgi:hypothetical protein
METTTPTPTTATQVAAFKTACKTAGWTYEAHGEVVTVHTTFAPGDRLAYIAADNHGYSLLSLVPTVTYGSTWGTDGGSVGGASGLSGGYYRLSKSGCSKRFVKALMK